MIWEDAELIQLRQFDCFMESTPQLLLNLYIMLKGEFHFGGISRYFSYIIPTTFGYQHLKKKNSIYFRFIDDFPYFLRHQLVMGIGHLRSEN